MLRVAAIERASVSLSQEEATEGDSAGVTNERQILLLCLDNC